MTPDRSRMVVPGSEKEPMRNTQVADNVPAGTILDVTVRVRRRQELPPLSADCLPSARPHLSIEEYTARYGADMADLEKVEVFAGQYGLQVKDLSASRRSVLLTGTAAAFSQAFGVDLKIYRYPGGTYRGRIGPVFVPPELDGIVTGVFGLDDRPFARPHFRTGKGVLQENNANARFLPPGMTPTEVARLYNFPMGVNGQGQTIGIIQLGGGFRQEELQTYFTQLGLPTPDVRVASFPGSGENRPGIDALDPANPDVEVMLAIQVAGAVASGAQIVVYFAPDTQDQSFLDALTAAVTDNIHRPSVISVSWGGPETSATKQFLDNFNQVLQTAAHLGITVCVAAGGHGSADCLLNDTKRQGDGKCQADFPATSPFALACGGTRLEVAGNTISSEVVWHPCPHAGTAGVSRFFPLPDYQQEAEIRPAKNTRGAVRRGLPDVAGNAAPESGYRILCNGQSFPDPKRGVLPVGGTSAAASLWAGLVALINQTLDRRVGYIHPLLYNLLPTIGAFSDPTDSEQGGDPPRRVWDPGIGLGTPDGQRLLVALQSQGDH